MSKLLVYALIIVVLQGHQMTGKTEKIGLNFDFKAFENLPSLRCSEKSFGSAGKRLTDSSKILEAEDTFSNATQKLLYSLIRLSNDFDLTDLNEGDVKVMMNQLMNLSLQSRTQFTDLQDKWANMSSAERKLIFQYPKPLTMLKKSVFCSIQEDSEEDELSEYCTQLADKSVSTNDLLVSLDRCAYCAALLVSKRAASSHSWSTSASKCEALVEKITQRFPDGWDVDFLRICPMVMKPGDLRRISRETFCTPAQLDKFANPTFGKMLPRKLLGKIGERIIECKGDLSSWTKEAIKKFLHYVDHLPFKFLKSLNFIDIADVIDDVVTTEDDLKETMFLQVASKKISKNWKTQASSLLPEMKTKLMCVELATSANRKIIEKDTTVADLETFLGSAKSQCGQRKIKPAAIQRVVRRIIRQPGFTWSSEKFDLIKEHIDKLSPRVIKQIPDQLLCDNWQDMKDKQIPKKLLRLMFKKCSSRYITSSSFTCDTLTEMGSLLIFLPRNDFTAIPDNVVGACITNIGDNINRFCNKARARCRAVMDKVVAYAANNNIKIGTIVSGLGTELAGSMRSFDGLTLEDMGGIDAIDENKHYRPAEARKLLKLAKQSLGQFNSSNPEFCDKFSKLRPLMVVAGDDSMWDNVCEDGNLIENIAAAAPDIGEMSSSNIETITEKLLRVFNAKDKQSVCVDKSLVERVAPFLLHARPEDILSFDKKTRRAIMKAAGSHKEQVQRLHPKKVKFLTAMTFKDEGLSNTATITEEEIDRIGSFALCGMSNDQVTKLDDDALTRFFPELLSCPDLDEETLQALVKKLKPVTDDFEESYLSKMGAAIGYVLDELTQGQKQEKKEAIVSNLREFSEDIKNRTEKIRDSDDRVISAVKKVEYKDKYMAAMRQLITYAIEVKTSSQGGSRRKRSTGDMDCSLLADIKDNAEALTVSQINEMDTTEVMNCVSELSETSWDESQCGSWRTHLISANGLGSTPSTWDKTDLQGLGTLVDCLTPSEVQSLDVDESVLTVLGQTNLQKAADVIAAYMSTSQPDLATLSDSTITNMGHMFCGLSTAQITQLPTSAVLTSAKDLSELPCASEAQLTAVGNAIVSEVGSDWSGLDPFLVQELGVWIAGLSTNVLQTFSVDHIKHLSTRAIPAMTASKISTSFDSNEFEELTREQFDALTVEQIQQLPKEYQDIVNANSDYTINMGLVDDGATGNDDPTGKGVSSRHCPGPLLVIVILSLVARMLY